MTVTVQQLQEKIAGISPDARIFVFGKSRQDYPITEIIPDAPSRVNIIIEDSEPSEDEDEDEDEDE